MGLGPRPDRFCIDLELGHWVVTTVSGSTLEVAAHAFTEEDDSYVFSVLTNDRPGIDIEIVRIPRVVVATIYGG